MASPTHASSSRRHAYSRRVRRSSYTGARQLNAAQAKSRRVLIWVGLLIISLLAALGTIAFHLSGEVAQ